MFAWAIILLVPVSIVALIIWDAETLERLIHPSDASAKASPVATLSTAVAVFSAFLSVASVAVSKRSSELAEQSLVAANRPWVKVDIQVGGPITYNANGANFTLKYVLKNIGHSPAVNVGVYPRIIFPIIAADTANKFNPRDEMLKDIAERKAGLPGPFGYTLFPDETIAQDVTVSISHEDLKRATKLLGAIYPKIVGSVLYRIGFDAKPHQTGFIVEVRRNDVPRPSTVANNRVAAVIWVDEGEVPAGDVRLFRSALDGGYAD